MSHLQNEIRVHRQAPAPAGDDRQPESGQEILERAFVELESEVPDLVARALRRLRSPDMRWVRIVAGILCIVAAGLWFLPVLGLEFLPIGLLLLAQDIPFLRKPLGHAILWTVERWRALKRWWARRHAHDASGH